MAEGDARRAPTLLPRGVKAEDGAGGAQPKEEAVEEQPPPPAAVCPPQSLQEETPMVLNAYSMAPSARRKREKGGGPEGTALCVDRRKSKVWNYYTKLGDAYVECTVCRKQLSFHNSTTTMREHLVRKHGIRDAPAPQLREEQPPEPDGAEPPGKRPRQATPEGGPSHGEPRGDVVLELVLEMIFRDLHPLSVVKDKGFGLLLGCLEPGFSLPSPAQLAAMLRQRYGVARQHLERYLRSAQSLVLCAELWASQPGHGYVTVSASFIDAQWRRARCVLETRPGDAALGTRLRAALAAFGLSSSSVLCVLHDGPEGAEEEEEEEGWAGLCCAARALQLCVAAGLRVAAVQEALGAARRVVGFFQRDPGAAASLGSKLEAIGKGRLQLVLDAGARWLSTVEMCERLLELKWAVMAVLEEQPRGAAQGLADHQWKLLQELLPVLRTVRLAASFLREEHNGSVSALMPCVHGVAAAVARQAEAAGDAVTEAVGNIRAELARRWGLPEDEGVLDSPAVIASFLDPRFKELRFLSPGLRSELHRRVKAMLSHGAGPPSPAAARGAEPGTKESGTGSPAQSAYDILLGKDPTESMPELHQQLENYLVEPLCRRSTDPLHWWRRNEHRFPAVARLGRLYLAVPATAAPPQLAFAGTQSALQCRRAALEPEHLHHVLFLHHNWELVEAARGGAEARGWSLR